MRHVSHRQTYTRKRDAIRLRRVAYSALLGALIVGACTSEPTVPAGEVSSRAIALATPAVTMEASPPPPFTYWAPEGSTIRNHPRDLSIWIAVGADGSQTYYFGDQCRASERQDWIGQSVDALPSPPSGATWRVGCTTCEQTSDLQWERLNVSYDERTRRIVTVSCG